MAPSSRYLAALVSSIVVFQCVQLVASKGGPFEAIERVFEAMEDYARGVKDTSGLTMLDIRAAVLDWRSLSPQARQKLKDIPLLKLTIDFVVHPIELVSREIREQPTYQAVYVQRAERAYKAFRRAYVEVPAYSQIFPGKLAKANKFIKIYKAINRAIPRKDITIQDLLMAKGEYAGWKAKLDEITELEDVYSNIPMLKKMFNYFNNVYLHTLATEVLPLVNKDSDVQRSLDLLLVQLEMKHNIVYSDGKFVRFISPTSESSETISQVKADDTPLRDSAPSDDDSDVEFELEVPSAPMPGVNNKTTKTSAKADTETDEEVEAEAMQPSAGRPKSGGWRMSAPEDEAFL